MEIEFTHKQSAHCENGVVSNLMRHHGIPFSEPMVFGIGSGLLFCYIPLLKVNHAPAITYRAMPGMIFKRFAKRVGITFKREKFSNPKKAQAQLDANLANSNPVGLQVGVYHLTYFPEEYRFHFNAHNLVVYGKDNDHYLISDPVMEEVTTLTSEELERVRFAKGAFAPKGQMYYPIRLPETIDLKPAILKGIKHTCRDMLAPVPYVGVKGIKTIAKLVRSWPEKKGPKRAKHYLGQIVRMQEEIGTGGGGFRYIYAAFLQEAADVVNKPEWRDMSQEMTQIGDQWRDFALQASRVYKDRSSLAAEGAYDTLATQLKAIAEKEKVFFKKLKKTLP